MPLAQLSPTPTTLILAPPLTGCSTLADLISHPQVIIDTDHLDGYPVYGLKLVERRAVMARLVDDHPSGYVICLPVLPSLTLASRVSSVVIIPAKVFARRIDDLSSSRFAEGHRAAAVAWRDEAVALAAAYRIPVYSKLSHVPTLRGLRIGA
jgi:hypothetical protein